MIETLPCQRVDLSLPVDSGMLDIDAYSKKFDLWHRVHTSKELDPSVEKFFLEDFTYWVYSYFKNEKGENFKLTSYQDLIAQCVLQHDFTPTNPNRYVLYRAANQCGKSALLILLAIYLAFMRTNVNIVMVSNNLRASQFLTSQIRQMLNTSIFADRWHEVLGETANTTHLTFEHTLKNGTKSLNRIICVPAGEGALGYPVHYMFLDEADFYENAKHFFWKVALPRTNKTKGQIILFSNPNPDVSNESSLLYEAWNGTFFQRKFHFTFLDAPWNTREEFELVKQNSPSYIFESTHLGEFPTDSGSFFTRKEIDDMFDNDLRNELPVVQDSVYLGLDLAKVRDNTVLTLGTLEPNKQNPKLNDLYVRYIKKYPTNTPYDSIVSDLKNITDFYREQSVSVRGFGFDATGVGGAISDFIRREGIMAQDINFSLQSKSKLYANFKLLAEQRRIHICTSDDARNQISTLVFKKTPKGYLSVQHESESLHDDVPDSIVCLIQVSVMPSKVPVTAQYVGGRTPITEKSVKTQYEKDVEQYMSRTIMSNNSMSRMRDPYA